MEDPACGQPFITTWTTTTPNEQITIPTTGGGYLYNVDWGDSNNDVLQMGPASHTYVTAGTYTVSINGNFPRIFFNNGGDKQKIHSVEQWGDIEWTSMRNAFSGCGNLVVNALDTPDLNIVTDMLAMFNGCSSLTGNVGHWDVSHVTNMNLLFQSASAFNGSLNDWDVHNVSEMTQMFNGCHVFNQPLGSWDVGHVNAMQLMFKDCYAFNQDIGNWDVGNVTTMLNMFNSASAFDRNIGGWNVSKVMTMVNMFAGAGLATENYDSLLIGWASLDSLKNGVSFNAGTSQYCEGVQARQEIMNLYGWSISDFGYSGCDTTAFVTTWKTDNPGSSNNTSITIPCTGGGYSYDVDWNNDGVIDQVGITGSMTHDFGIAGTYLVRITGSFPRIYFNHMGDTSKILSVDQWGDIAWASMASAFSGCANLQVLAVDTPDLSGVTDMSGMFSGCVSLNSDISSWDVSGVTDMSGMFFGMYCS